MIDFLKGLYSFVLLALAGAALLAYYLIPVGIVVGAIYLALQIFMRVVW